MSFLTRIISSARIILLPTISAKLSSSSELYEYFVVKPKLKSTLLRGHTSLHALSQIKKNMFLVVVQNTTDREVHINKILSWVKPPM